VIRSTQLTSTLAGALTAVVLLSTPAVAAEIDAVIGAHGATFLPFEAGGQTGNGYGVSGGINVHDFRVMAGLAGVLPGARSAGRFTVVWAEAQWHPFHETFAEMDLLLSPYAVAGLGVAMPDDFADAPELAPDGTIRWVPNETQVMSIAGLGLAVGEFNGFFVAVDMRLYNVAYGGFVVTAGYCF